MVDANTFDDSIAKRPFVPQIKSAVMIDLSNYETVF